MFRDAALVAAKDLRVELRSRVALYQVLPVALLTLVLFAFALDPDRGILQRATPGLFWIAVLFSAVLAVQRAFAVEAGDGVADALRLSGLGPSGIFLGKMAGIAVQLLALEVVLAAGVVVLYDARIAGWGLVVVTCLAASAAIAAAGALYGALSTGVRVRDTLLPLLLLPVLAPVLLAGTRAIEAALADVPGDGWPWVGLLAVVALVYTSAGAVAFGPLLEDS